jgi:hypothetical protein
MFGYDDTLSVQALRARYAGSVIFNAGFGETSVDRHIIIVLTLLIQDSTSTSPSQDPPRPSRGGWDYLTITIQHTVEEIRSPSELRKKVPEK